MTKGWKDRTRNDGGRVSVIISFDGRGCRGLRSRPRNDPALYE